MTSYDETSITKKCQVEVAISYKDMGGRSSLSHQLPCFKARIICQLAHLKYLNKVFLVADNESEIRFSKFKMADSIWRSLYL